ncbi:MAG: glutamate racemase [Solobacterium sp.]|nr:glutamate racemase [Solobacterium sp.]
MMERNKYIGIFDSGIGGLTVARSIIEKLPEENIIYFGDTAHLPYGTKSEKQIREYAYNDVKFLMQFELKSLVIACNTADSVARKSLEKTFNIPIYGVIKPASKKAAASTKNNRIGVMATAATVRSNAYTETIHKYNPEAQVFSLACPLLVPLVENGRYKKDDIVVTTILKEYIDQLLVHDVDTIVLGCTHYPLLYDAIKSIIPDVNVISSSEAAADMLMEGLETSDMLANHGMGNRQYYVSDDAENFKENARVFLGDKLCEDAQLAQV